MGGTRLFFCVASAFFLSWLVPLPAAAGGRSDDAIAAQRVVTVREARSLARVRSLIEARQAVVLGGGERFLVIAPGAAAGDSRYAELLQALASDPDVERIVADRPVYPLEDSHARAAPPTGGVGKRADGPGAGCRLFPRCGGSNPAWPKLQVGADLAENIVTRSLDSAKERQIARVAVVDSGFDTRNQSAGIEAVRFNTLKGHATAGNKDIDPDGHGTAVAGMVAGKNIGITHQVELNVYRVTPENAGGSVSNGLLAAAIEKACEANDVVNVSWGSQADELGLTKVEEEPWYRKAAERGCLVIQSSGNSGIQTKDRPRIPLEAPLLTVAASDQFSDEASFSTSGGIFGPGAGVFSLLSHQHEYGDETTKNACSLGKSRVGPIDGTSFASPLVAGVAAQVITILKSRGVLPKEGAPKIRLVKAILLASAEWSRQAGSRQATVSAIGAALIASAVTKGTATDAAALLAAARGDGDFRKRCGEPTADCTREKDCDRKRACVSRLRFQSLACVPPPPGVKASPDLSRHLFAALKEGDERELITQLIDRLPTGSPLAKDAIAELDRQWSAIIKEGAIDIGNTTRALNLLHAARRTDLAKGFDLPQKLRQLMGSYSFGDIFAFQFPLGTTVTQSSQERQAAKFMDIFRALPADEQAKIIAETPRAGAIEPQLDFLYHLHFNAKRLSPETRRALETRMREVATLWFTGKLGDDFIGVPSTGPATEALFRALPDGAAKLAALMKEGPTKENERNLRFAVLSPTALGKNRLELIEKLATHPKLREEYNYYVLNGAIEALARDGSPKAIRRTVRRVLLENPQARLPLSAFSESEFTLTATQKALGKDDFFPRFIQVNIRRGIERASAKEVQIELRGHAIGNVIDALAKNALMPKEARKTLLAGAAGKDLARWLTVVSGNLVRAKDIRAYDVPTQLEESRRTVNAVLDQLPTFVDAGFRDQLRASLDAIRRDMAANREKYPQSMRQAVGRLYGLAE